MNELKSIQINQLLRVLEGMENTKRLQLTRLTDWGLETDTVEMRTSEEAILLGYELLACYGSARTIKQVYELGALQRIYIMHNLMLLPVEMTIAGFKMATNL